MKTLVIENETLTVISAFEHQGTFGGLNPAYRVYDAPHGTALQPGETVTDFAGLVLVEDAGRVKYRS
jgi:hypothetical protein